MQLSEMPQGYVLKISREDDFKATNIGETRKATAWKVRIVGMMICQLGYGHDVPPYIDVNSLDLNVAIAQALTELEGWLQLLRIANEQSKSLDDSPEAKH